MHAGSLAISHSSYAFPKAVTSNPVHTSWPFNDLRATTLSKASVIKQDLIISQKLLEGDEETYEVLITKHYSSMVRVALQYVPTRAIADEVVQETWLGFLQSLQRFEGRCSIKTWLFRILTNRAKTRGVQEHRYVPLPGETHGKEDSQKPEGSRETLTHDRSHHHSLTVLPETCDHNDPETRLLAKEGVAHIESAIQALPPRLRQIIFLRDVEGWSPEEVCELLNLSVGNQRVLLHRARVRVRDYLAPVFQPSDSATNHKK